MSAEHSFQLALAEAAQWQMRARYQEQRIVTGVWKERIGKVHQGAHDGPLVPEQEILKSEVAIMNRHIGWAEEHLDAAKGHMNEIHLKEARASESIKMKSPG